MTFTIGQRVLVVDEPWFCGHTEQADGYVGLGGYVAHLPASGRIGIQLYDGMWYFETHQIVADDEKGVARLQRVLESRSGSRRGFRLSP